MWKYIEHLNESQVDSLWEQFKDVPFIFDDNTDGDYEKFKVKSLDPSTKWYQINDGYIMVSDFKDDLAIWHTLVLPHQLSYRDAWEIMLDVFDRFDVRLILSGVPEFHPRALRAATKAGFVVIQVTPDFTERWGKKHAMHFMAIDKEIVKCQQQSLLQLQL